MRTTLKDVAREAGVSYETVSRCLHNRGPVKAETAKRIRAAAARLHYTPNCVARGLRARNTLTAGVILPCIYENEFFAGLFRGIEDRLLEAGYATFLCNSNFDSEREALYLQRLAGQQVDGVFLAPVMNSDGSSPNVELIASQAATMNMVLLDRQLPELDIDHVASDHRQAMASAVQHLIDLGHRRIATFLIPGYSSTRERHEGYLDTLSANDVDPQDDLVIWFDLDDEGAAYAAADVLLKRPHESRPTALICSHDLEAINLYRAANNNNLKVPDDVSVVSFDDFKLATQLSPSLTSLRQDLRGIGREAAALFLQRLDDERRSVKGKAKKMSLPTSLIVRESTARAS